MTDIFNPGVLKQLYKPSKNSTKKENGQVTIIGGSSLFHGAPLLSLKVASRIVDMVFFSSPEESVGEVAAKMKSELLSFIWVPWNKIGEYIQKSDAALIGPGFMRYSQKEGKMDDSFQLTKEITKNFLMTYPDKKWVIDAGSLQTLELEWIPQNSVLTPNNKEYERLFSNSDVNEIVRKYHCIIAQKGPVTHVCSSEKCLEISNGNAGLTKGGTGDVQAGLTVALLAKNDPLLSASVAAFVTKAAADELYKKVGVNYNADDLAEAIPQILYNLIK